MLGDLPVEPCDPGAPTQSADGKKVDNNDPQCGFSAVLAVQAEMSCIETPYVI